jgi:hypothetical protein
VGSKAYRSLREMATTLCHEAGLRQRLGSNAEATLTGAGWAEVEPSVFRGRDVPPVLVEVEAVEPQLIAPARGYTTRGVYEPLRVSLWLHGLGVLRRTTRPRGAVGEARDPTLDVSRETSSLAGAASIEMTPARPGDHRTSAQDARRLCEHGPDPPPHPGREHGCAGEGGVVTRRRDRESWRCQELPFGSRDLFSVSCLFDAAGSMVRCPRTSASGLSGHGPADQASAPAPS